MFFNSFQTTGTKEINVLQQKSTFLHVFIYTCKQLSGYVRATVRNIT